MQEEVNQKTVALFLFVGCSLCMAKKISVVYPRVEMQENPLGIDLKNPHFFYVAVILTLSCTSCDNYDIAPTAEHVFL